MSTRAELEARFDARKNNKSTKAELEARLEKRLATKTETAKDVQEKRAQEEPQVQASKTNMAKTLRVGELIAEKNGFSPALPYGAQLKLQNAALKKQYEEEIKPEQEKEKAAYDRLFRSENQIEEREIKNEISAMQEAHPEWQKDTLYLAAFGGEDFADAGVFDLETWDVYKNLPETYDGIKDNVITKAQVEEWRAQGYSDKDIAEHLRLYAENAADFQNTESDALINKHLTQKEKYNFLRLWEEKGRDTAEEYLNSLRDTVAAREGAQIYSKLDSGFDKRAFQYKSGLKKGLQGFEAMGYASDLKSQTTPDDVASSLILEDSLNNDGSKSFTTYLDMGLQSAGSMTPSMVVGAIPGVGTVARALTTIGTAGGSAMIEARRQGKEYNESLAYGLLSGSSEAGLDFLLGGIGKGVSGAVSKLGGKALENTAKAFSNASPKVATLFKWAGTFGGKMSGEFLEEYSQEILDPVFRNIVFDENNDVKLFTSEALEAGLLGAAMAVVFDGFGIGSAIDVRNDSAVDAQIARELSKNGLSDAEIDKAIAEFRNIVPYNTMSDNAIKEMFANPAEQTRNTFSSAGQAAFDIAMESATDKDAAATQFRIKYLEGEMGKAFEVDTESELTSVMQRAAYKYGAEAAKEASATRSYNQKAGTVYIEEGAEVSSSLKKIADTAAKDLHVPVSLVKTLDGDRGYYLTKSGELVVAADAVVKVKDKDGNDVILKGDEAARRIILGHELTHRLKHKGGKAYTRFENFVRAHVPNFDSTVAKYMEALRLGKTAATEEVVCDYAMVHLFSDAKLAEEITVKHSKIAEIVRDFIEWVRVTLGKADKLSDIELAAKFWNDAYSAAARNGAKTKNTADGDVKYSRVKNINGIPAYESDFTDNISADKREEIFKKRIGQIFALGAVTLKTDTKKILVQADRFTWNKTLYGDGIASQDEREAIINSLYDLVDILESSTYFKRPKSEEIEPSYADPSIPPKNKAHKDVKYWYKFKNRIYLDGNLYDVVFNVRDKGKSQYEYLIEMHQDGKKKENPNISDTATKSSFARTLSGSPNNNVPQTVPVVNTQSMQKSQNNAETERKSVAGTEDILFESEAEKVQYVADSFDLSGAENYKAAGSMERMSAIVTSIAKAHRVNKDGRAKLAKALEKGVQNMRKAAKADDAKTKQTAAEGFLEAAMIISPDADVQAQVEIANALAESVWAEMTTDRLTDTIRSIRDEAINSARADVRAERLAQLGEKYGTIKPGERPSRVVTLPKKTSEGKKVSQTVRTVMEAEATPDEMIPTLEQMVADGEFSYETITDKGAVAKAEDKITKQGFDATVREWFKAVGSGKVSKDNTALGWTIYNNAANSGDTELAVEVLCEMVKHQRNAAQALQATRILKKMSPSGQLYAAQKNVQGLQEELEAKYGDKAPELKIDPKLADKVVNGETEEIREKALADLYRDIGRQMPSSVLDKWNAWRYLSMLGNARTHIRNIVGNAGFAPVVTVKNITATGIESLVGFVFKGKMGRTKAFLGLGKTDRTLLAAAWSDYEAVADAALGDAKYNDNQIANKYIEEGKRVFKFKPLEGARRGNSWLLDKEDSWFSKPQYANALAQYCKANGITVEQIRSGKDLEKARAYAIKEAQKATYRDTNAFSELFSKLGKMDESGEHKLAKKIWNRGVEGVLPFRKTPANILARGVEYSPIGLGVGLWNMAFDIKSGKVTAAEAIDKMSAGLTGSGLMALGAFLVAQGVLRGFGGDDEKEKEYMELMGHQQYALEIGGTSVTLDWLAPEALPFFVGANIAEQTVQGGEMTVEGLVSALGNISDPMLSMSCLQGLNDLIESVSFSSTSGLVTIIASAATSYLTQGIPTLFGQIERTFESERMTTYTDKNNKFMQYTLGKVSGKLPGDYSQIPYIDAWGRTEPSGNVGERAANNMLNPAYTSAISESDMEKELLRLYEQTGEPVLPSRADKSFPIDGEQVYLTAEQYKTYATSKGKRSHRILTALTKSDVYNDLDDFTKAEVVSKVYTYCNAMAKSSCGVKNSGNKGYALDGWVSKAYDACSKYGIDESTYIAAYVIAGNAGKYVNEGETVTNSPGLCIMNAVYSIPGLSQEQYSALFENFGVGSKVRGYSKKAVENKIAEFEKKYERVEG